MEAAIGAVCDAEMKDRIEAATHLVNAIIEGEAMTSSQVLRVIGSLVGWLAANNYKIVASALDCLQYVIACDPDAASGKISDLASAIRDNLGDSHEQVRDQCMELLIYLGEDVSTPQAVWDHLSSGLTHRVPRVRQQCLLFLERVVNKHTPRAIQISPHLKSIVNMVTDRDESVREAAASALCEVYRQTGQKIRRDISRVSGIPPAKMSSLMDRLDTVTVVAQARDSGGKAASSPKAPRKSMAGTTRSNRTSSAADSGGVDPDEFAAAMVSTEPIYAAGEADVDALFRDLKNVLPDTNAEWEKRVDVCRRLRGLANGNGTDYQNFTDRVQSLGNVLTSGVSDLRSSVSKEACITTSQLSSVLGLDFEAPLKVIIPALFKQAQIHTKVLAQSAQLCLEHVFATCHAHRLLPLLRESSKHRSVEIRRAVYASVRLVLEKWEVETLKKQVAMLCDMVHDGQVDADASVRQTARASYWLLEESFPTQAKEVFRRLDSTKQKHLMKSKNGDAAPVRKTRISRKVSSPVGSSDDGADSRADGPASKSGGPGRVSLSSSMPAAALRREKEMGHLAMPQRVARPQTVGTTSKTTADRGDSRGGARRVQTDRRASATTAAERRASATTTAERRTSATSVTGATPRRVPTSSRPPSGRHRSVTDTIDHAMSLARDSDWNMRLEGARQIRAIITPDAVRQFSARDMKNLSEYFVSRLSDANAAVLAANAEALHDFVLQCGSDASRNWIRDCTSGLINRISGDVAPLPRSKLTNAFTAIQNTVASDIHLEICFQALSKSKQYTIEFSTPKARAAQLNHMAKMASTCSAQSFAQVYGANEIDCIAATQRLASYSTKSTSTAGVQPASKAVIIALFSANPSVFADIFSKLPPADNKALRKALNSSELDWEATLDAATPDDGERMASRARGPKSSTEAFDLAVSGLGDEFDDDDIVGANFMSAHDEVSDEDESEDVGHPAPQAMNGVSGDHHGYNPTAYQDDGVSTDYAQSNGVSVHDDDVQVDGPYHQSDDEGHDYASSGQDGDGYKAVVLAQDFALNGATDVDTDIVPMLEEFMLATKEYPDDFWMVHFDTILHPVMELLDHQIPRVRALSLKVLRHLVKAQTPYFGDAITAVLRKLLGMHAEQEREVLRSAEETLSILSTTVLPREAALLLKPIIATEDGPVLLASIKLLTKVLKKLSKPDLEDLLQDIIPGLAQSYKHAMAEVRKGVVFALVEIHLVLGDSMMPHLSDLSSSQMKLLGIYIKRAEDKLQEQRSGVI